MGGTFDPIHLGHLAAAEAARLALGLERVYFMPAARSPVKGQEPVASPRDRYQMTLLATYDHPAFFADSLELDRPAPSYTIDTLREIRLRLGQEVTLYFILGGDAALSLPTWREAESLLRTATFVVVTRPGYDLSALEGVRSRLGILGQRLVDLEGPRLDISSRDIRQRVAAGLSWRYLVPPAVAAYIEKQGLYLPYGSTKPGR